jgi:hypothetical protein
MLKSLLRRIGVGRMLAFCRGTSAAVEIIPDPPVYDADGLTIRGRSTEFLSDPRFVSAYKTGTNSGHRWGEDIRIEWRIAVTNWAAAHGARLAGDFVECGVCTGVHSLAICEYLNFNELDKDFYLFDTFYGIPLDQTTPAGRDFARQLNETYYFDCYQLVQRNFAPWPRAKLVRGRVPDTLSTVSIERVAYLSIDMNVEFAERAAIEHFWPKLTPGAVVVLDDYGLSNHREQKLSHDEFAKSVGVEILLLPTGQGLMIKP